MEYIKKQFPKIDHDAVHPLYASEREAFLIKPIPKPSEFSKNLTLVPKGYDTPCELILRPYQIEPVDAITRWRRVIFSGATRTFKSGITDVCAFWAMKYLKINGIITYAETETAKLVFKTRILPMIKSNPALRELWDGNEDNLTIDNILLMGSFWRIASAQNINDLATFGAGFIIGSEVSKWEKMIYDPIDTLYGRQKGCPQHLRFSIIESSPNKTGDCHYNEIYKDGVLILRPAVPCPTCGEYQILSDYIPGRDGSPNEFCIKLRDPNFPLSAQFIRNMKEAAVKYECRFCKNEIRESDRIKISRRIKYIAPEIYEGEKFHQKAEKILKDGTIIDEEKRDKFETVCFQWSRLVDEANFPFYECLARFAESKNIPQKKKTYDNEDMARHTVLKAARLEVNSFESKKRKYFSRGALCQVPDEVLVCTCGVDSMDDYFYYVIPGWGENMSSWVLRYGKIFCPIDKNRPLEKTLEIFKNGLYESALANKTGSRIYPIKQGFIDRGGHRAADVDYITDNLGFMDSYVGLTKIDPKKSPLYKSMTKDDNGEPNKFYLGQTPYLSYEVGKMMDGKLWFLPMDVSDDFIKQANAQYFKNKTLSDGRIESEWIHDEVDHYRDCLNLAYAAALLLELDSALFDPAIVARLKERISSNPSVKKEQKNNNIRNSIDNRSQRPKTAWE
ncbi:MAG: phage terminase large subunit family protein [Ignavibacteria bacterium]|nr:phage terminase large subunit family protein [Ignavibacteria bacterium]